MKKIFLVLKGAITLFGLTVILILLIFFYKDPDLKFKEVTDLVKQSTGLGADYSAFTAQSFADYAEVLKKNIFYHMGIDREYYPILNLSLDMATVSSLNRQRKGPQAERSWLKGDLISQNKNQVENIYKIKLKPKGDRAIHNNDFDEMSFKIDIRGKKRFMGLEEFSLQHPIVRNYGWEMLINSVAQSENLLAPDYEPVDLYFNGDSRGIFIIEEGFGVEFLERRGRKAGPIFSINEPLGTTFPGIFYEPYEASKISNNNSHYYNMAYTKLNDFKSNYQKKNVSRYFDLNIWAKYFSIIDFFGAYHGAVPKSVKLYFNPTTQLFEPIMFDNHMGGRGYLSFSLLDFYSGLNVDECGYVCSGKEWFEFFFKDKSFIKEYVRALKDLQNKFSEGLFDDNIAKVEKFNNAMYGSFASADRVFYASPLLYYFDIDHLNKRSRLLSAKIIELTGYDVSSIKKNSFAEDFLYFQKAYSDKCKLILSNKECGLKKFEFISDLQVIDQELKLNNNTVLVLNGKTFLKNASIFSEGRETMIIQIGGEFIAKDTIFNNFENVFVPGTNWTGAVNLLGTDADLDNVIFQNSKGEDALNLVNGHLNSTGGIQFKFIDQDAFDSDNSIVNFEKIICTNVGNDCLDTSYSNIKGESVNGQNIGDKLISIGEQSYAYLDIINCKSCGIGVAVKDLSKTNIGSFSFSKTPLYFSIFQKKEIFGPGIIFLNSSDADYSDILNKSMIGDGSLFHYGNLKFIGGESSELIKKSLYGNKYGKASAR